MNSLVMTKAQLTVLLDTLQAPSAVISVGTLPALTAAQYTEILARLLEDGVIDSRGGAFVPDRAVAQRLAPMLGAGRTMLYCCRERDRVVFNASVYFAGGEIAVLREDGADSVSLLSIDSCEDLELLLPEPGEWAGQEISYTLLASSHAVTHRAFLTPDGGFDVRERRFVPGSGTEENEFSCSAGEYRELRSEMIREVRHAAGG